MPTFETPEPISVAIELVLGDARISASDRRDTSVVVAPTNPAHTADVEAASATRVELTDGRLLVRAPRQWKRFSPFDTGGSVQVRVEVPTGSSIDADSSLGDLHGEGELGPCRFKTAMGNIRLDRSGAALVKTGYGNIVVDHVVGDLDATTGSGDVRVGEVEGAATIKNSNGATRLHAATGDVHVKAANGEIVIDRAGASVTARTANGPVRVGEVARGVVVLETSAGALECGVAEGTAAWLDVRSQHGQVRSSLDATDAPSATEQTVEIRGRTSIGDIVIRRTSEAHP